MQLNDKLIDDTGIVSKLIASILGIEAAEVNGEDFLVDDLGCDSMDIAALVSDLEETVGVDLSEVVMTSDVRNMRVSTISTYLAEDRRRMLLRRVGG